ncbi:uncharacterized protein N7515_007946 [Penicillium bovifimosum]|uniref:Uncharacterized protein n=1 Tax=Penicillium bovifimosum TaxID=126998 RepID=A0A9W9KX96_9EURO|nr:uncharacterized protein N7515_007946 [Penicillium bovifimosum]KAJ5124121.1 hypothetical protein N7515_007946 [Penicillium bovifimosum]
MADPTNSHGRGAQNFRMYSRTNTETYFSPSSSNPRSPLSPGSSGGTPISFQPNVNRSKTKRWVEAKQYSYDGGDWGDEEEDEEEEEEAPPVPRPPYATHNTGSSSDLASRRLSGLTAAADERASADGKGSNPNIAEKPLPFVRPADLYKRMREEQAAQQSPPPESKVPQLNSFGNSTQQTQQPPLGLPEVKRVSAFGTDFLNGSNSIPQYTPTHQDSSSGFQSVVQQAFDVPETPQSTTTSVARSNSDGTSTISPIIGGRSMTDDRTPTIPEEPNEPSPKATATAAPVINPGHRRDLSLPGSDNSPSRKPQITDLDTPTAGHAELASVSTQDLTPQASDAGSTPQNPSMQPYSNEEADRPAPLKFGNTSGPENVHGEIPTIRGAEDSPQNADNDRLREEIIRSLSREATPSEDPGQSGQPQPQAPAASIPQQFEKYWDGQTGPGPNGAPEAMVTENHPDWTGQHPLASKDPYSQSPGEAGKSSSAIFNLPKKPKLERRFSWESSDDEEPEPQIPGSHSSPPPVGTSLSMQEPQPIADEAAPLPSDAPQEAHASDIEGSDAQPTEKPRLSIVPPVPENITPPEQIGGPGTTPPPQVPIPSNVGTISLDESKLLGFRDILGITSINQRIKSFEHTRDQFATLDTGLTQWLQFTVQENPEYAGLVQQNQNVSPNLQQPSPSRSRFPKLGSLGALGSLNDGTPTSATHIRRPSGHIGTVMNREKVGEKGKELLHTAGAFSGKASGAAKGLFAKGRSKFRPSGGPDKVQSTPSASRRSFQLSFPSGSGDVAGNSSSLRNSVTFGSLPIFKSGRTEANSVPGRTSGDVSLDNPQDEENARNAPRPGDVSLSHNLDGDSAVQPTQLASPPGVPPKADKFDHAQGFEQEMIASFGLSPTDPSSRRSASTPVATSSHTQMPGDKGQFKELPHESAEPTTGNRSSCEPSMKQALYAEKSLPLVPNEHSDSSASSMNKQTHWPSKSTPDIVTTSAIPVVVEDTKPPPPPKDNGHGLAPDGGHERQHSVSTLGPDEQTGGPSEADNNSDPPSPLRETSEEVPPKIECKDEHLHNGNSVPTGNASSAVLPSAHKKRKSFIPFYPSKSASSTESLESRRKSINGLPPSTPDVQSPLRNEVRYSPGSRSRMLRFGKHSANDKSSRPLTPAKDLSQTSEAGSSVQVQNEESAIGKLKSFGRRRRSSVGDLLSSIQGQGSQVPAAHERKRSFGRISVLFGRQDSQDPEKRSTDDSRRASEPIKAKDLPMRPTGHGNGNADTSTAQDAAPVLSSPFEANQPMMSPVPQNNEHLPSSTPGRTSISPQRASISLPPSSSSASLSSGRFYSQFRSAPTNEPPTSSQLLLAPPLQSRSPSPISLHENRLSKPLSPLEEIESPDPYIQRQLQTSDQYPSLQAENQDSQLGTLNENTEQEEREEDKVGKATISNAGISVSVSSHPLRSEDQVRVVNDSQPVELAITADDSSEEIVMSPTSYPGQEWRPMYT